MSNSEKSAWCRREAFKLILATRSELKDLPADKFVHTVSQMCDVMERHYLGEKD